MTTSVDYKNLANVLRYTKDAEVVLVDGRNVGPVYNPRGHSVAHRNPSRRGGYAVDCGRHRNYLRDIHIGDIATVGGVPVEKVAAATWTQVLCRGLDSLK